MRDLTEVNAMSAAAERRKGWPDASTVKRWKRVLAATTERRLAPRFQAVRGASTRYVLRPAPR